MKTKLMILALGVLLSAAQAQTNYQQLKSLGPAEQTGADPNGLIEGSDGALYGTTTHGGTVGYGTVFRLSKDGSGYTVLHSFSNTGGDGAYPQAGLIEGINGMLYGTTSWGGFDDAGIVFKLNKDGSGYTVLHQFSAMLEEGAYPSAALVEANDGVLYGTTQYGGTNYNGTVFKLNKDGSGYATLRSFTGSDEDGSLPNYLIEGSDGALYGTTLEGGIDGRGIVFKLNQDGSGFTVLHRFTYPGGDGGSPNGLMEGSDGVLYGTTWGGTVFKLNKDGSGYALLLNFPSPGESSTFPTASVVQGNDGALYGVMSTSCPRCLAHFDGVFKLNKDGSGYTVLHSELHYSLSACPSALLLGSDGALYGATWCGGDMNLGTVFKLLLPPFILTQPESQSAIEGEYVTFTVTATGTKPFNIQWQFNGIDLYSATNASLTLSHVQAADAGDYAVVVSNAVGTVTSTTVSLEVKTLAHAVDRLLQLVAGSYLHQKNQQPLLVTLKAARGAFERDKLRAGDNLLRAFQHKVGAQVAPVDPALADALIRAAQDIMDAVNGP